MDTAPARDDKRSMKHRRLLFALGAVIVAAVLFGLVNVYVQPTQVTRGPMVQNVSENAATLIWYTSKPSPGFLEIQVGDRKIRWPSENSDRRHRVRIPGLDAGRSYAYRIVHDGKVLSEAEFTTNKPAGQAFGFAVFGDSGNESAGQYRLAGRIAESKPDFVLHTGDLVYPDGDGERFRRRFFEPYKSVLSRVCFWPSLGNHDVGGASKGGDYLAVFELPENGPAALQPESNYWFDYGPARIAIVDSNLEEESLARYVAPWLADVMSDPTRPWKFVVFHHPPYCAAKHAPDERIQHTLVPVFEKMHVDVVFNGHNHLYQRTAPIAHGEIASDGAGVVYIITGAGGGELYGAQPPELRPKYILASNDQVFSFTQVVVDGDVLLLKQVSDRGDVLDSWSMQKAGATSRPHARANGDEAFADVVRANMREIGPDSANSTGLAGNLRVVCSSSGRE